MEPSGWFFRMEPGVRLVVQVLREAQVIQALRGQLALPEVRVPRERGVQARLAQQERQQPLDRRGQLARRVQVPLARQARLE